ncbi:hypothetical protein G6F62_013564 [Rhizopus arrhizus]|nr:hypothetical protein G6F62_013564 [Rhizopus arrhizus]
MQVYLPQDEPVATYPIVVANILASALDALAELLATRVAAGGRIALSGILHGQEGELLQRYAAWFDELQAMQDGDWMRITGVRVSETVPDGVLDRLHDIVLVDLPPRELIARLQQGKVYVPEQATQALQAFFSPANLTALRELAMQEAADRVDSSLRETRAARGASPG